MLSEVPTGKFKKRLFLLKSCLLIMVGVINSNTLQWNYRKSQMATSLGTFFPGDLSD